MLISNYIRPDLLLHMSVSAGICLLLTFFFPNWIAGIITLTIGIIKEIYDIYKTNPTGFDVADIIADILGILIVC